MTITSLETIRTAEHPNIIWVQLHTDDGLTGLGESWFGCGSIEADLHERIAPLILGEDARRISHLHHKMRPYVGFDGTSTEMRALSAVDVALWDLAGKRAGVPVSDLWGGLVRDSIQVYNTCAGPNYVSKTSDVRVGNFGLDVTLADQYDDLNGFMNSPAELAHSLLDMNIESMKIWPFDFAEGATYGHSISARDLKKALQPFEAIRKAVGDKMRIKAELHGLWGLQAAKDICKALEPYAPDWVEDPIWMDRLGDLDELAAATSCPIAGGETIGGLGQARTLIGTRGLTRPIIDVTWGGGITFALKAAALAEAHGKSIAFHDCSGPVTLTVSTHLALACPNVVEQEMVRAFYYGWYAELLDNLPPLKNGMITRPEGNGLGVELKESEGMVRSVSGQ